jgi:endonuclease YncB( thermonuclease family)
MWQYRAAVVRVIDGDSLIILADTGFNGRQEEHIRLLDVHAPEMSQPGGLETFGYVSEWCERLPSGVRWPIVIDTLPNTSPEPVERRSFVRYLATVREADWLPKDGPVRRLNDDIRAFLAGHPEWGSGM